MGGWLCPGIRGNLTLHLTLTLTLTLTLIGIGGRRYCLFGLRLGSGLKSVWVTIRVRIEVDDEKMLVTHAHRTLTLTLILSWTLACVERDFCSGSR